LQYNNYKKLHYKKRVNVDWDFLVCPYLANHQQAGWLLFKYTAIHNNATSLIFEK
jgi:hypothetical protein